MGITPTFAGGGGKKVFATLAGAAFASVLALGAGHNAAFAATGAATIHTAGAKAGTFKAVGFKAANGAIAVRSSAVRPADSDRESHVEGIVWFDANKNGERDRDEPGIENVKVVAKDKNEDEAGETTTDRDGKFRLAISDDGSFEICFEPREARNLPSEVRGENLHPVKQSRHSHVNKCKCIWVKARSGRTAFVDAGFHNDPNGTHHKDCRHKHHERDHHVHHPRHHHHHNRHHHHRDQHHHHQHCNRGHCHAEHGYRDEIKRGWVSYGGGGHHVRSEKPSLRRHGRGGHVRSCSGHNCGAKKVWYERRLQGFRHDGHHAHHDRHAHHGHRHHRHHHRHHPHHHRHHHGEHHQ
ncbi:hypothetical protein SAMN05421505_109167 [Sinosporangium album]|uniref:SD-repeat containing protein B domain-containing protein n=1 Tax=Sinosporangium album TaxID=504805 RepID=A0A1G7YAB7_9ACTN|nr:SdrD B-like domain-containing protein [Sinosporangium album]SDG93401.1 hypothetical protein SAMN05421505_109167 [Sinosporangium album]